MGWFTGLNYISTFHFRTYDFGKACFVFGIFTPSFGTTFVFKSVYRCRLRSVTVIKAPLTFEFYPASVLLPHSIDLMLKCPMLCDSVHLELRFWDKTTLNYLRPWQTTFNYFVNKEILGTVEFCLKYRLSKFGPNRSSNSCVAFGPRKHD